MNQRVIYISGPKRNMVPGYWLYDYLISDGYKVISFYLRKDDRELGKKRLYYLRLCKIIFYVVFKAKKNDLLLTYDSDTTAIYVALVISFLRPKLTMHKINCMAGNKDKLYSPFKKVFVRRAYTKIITTVNNDSIGDIFAKFLNIPRSQFVTIPDSLSDYGDEIIKIKDRRSDGYVFSGGNTNRDYALVVECARKLSNIQFKVVTSSVNKSFFQKIPPNIEVIYGLPENEFYKIMSHSEAIFVPLNTDMQGGQMVIFQGALLKKPIITTESIAIHTYFNNESIILIRQGDINEATISIRSITENHSLAKILGDRAFQDIIRFTTKKIYELYKSKLFNTDL